MRILCTLPLVLFPLILQSASAFGQSSADYIRWKEWCISQGGTPSGTASSPVCIPPAPSNHQSSPPSANPTPSTEELDRQAREKELERQRKEKERKQHEEAIRVAEQAAKEAEFIKKRNEGVTDLKGVDTISAPKLKEMSTPVMIPALKESDYFFGLQTRTLTPMRDGGHPIDSPDLPSPGFHGLVGGTTWTFGFKWPRADCDQACRDEIKKNLDVQHRLFCTSQKNPDECIAEGLPFTPEVYDVVFSMGNAHTFLEDFATRVYLDHKTLGEFSRQYKEIFASLKGRSFDTLDCHSNGAMLCLAALRSGDTTAKEVRLFGPQISPEAAKRWREFAAKSGTRITIYINEGDPVPALSWKLPVPRTKIGTIATLAWYTNIKTGAPTLAGALLDAYLDSKRRIMDDRLKTYGFDVIRNRDLDLAQCSKFPSIDCHSMKIYESRMPTTASPR